ncbi:hypothetical protein [Lentzea sp. E54]|uniref:hypothetical protein n=1 Tax=Lentzea xerophila TaxID=3435883 RepID=UPI003DA36BC8
MRVVLWLVLCTAAVVPVWLFVAWNIAGTAARRDAVRQIQDVTPALYAGAADGTLTPDEIRAAGAFEDGEEDGRLVVGARAHAERSWWTPFASGAATSDRYVRWVVDGTRVEFIRTS